MRTKRLLRRLACLACLALPSCDAADNLYSSLPAYFAMDNVLQAPVLHTALQSPGEYCTIRLAGGAYEFASPTQREPSLVNVSQLAAHSGFCMGLGGFVVGLPHIPELGRDASRPVCYDLACPNCYHESNFAKRMTLRSSGMVHCPACQRAYSAGDGGIVSQGPAGRPLIRYRISHAGHAMVINNR